MILIAAYWLFLFFLVLPLGILAGHALKISSQNTIITLLLGLVLLTCGFTLTAFFFPLGAESLVSWTTLSLISGIYYRREIRQQLTNFVKSLKLLPSYLKVVIGILTFGALLKSTQYPFIIDNESYYIQTIKWLNQYGFVKGIANLHIFLAQNSAWHILQAGTNLSFLTNKINDINGFVFILCTIYCITESHAYSTKVKMYWLSFMPLTAIFPFLFLDVPSPDLPLLVITPAILHLFIQHKDGDSNFRTALLLFVFLAFVKITIAPLGILFLGGLIKKDNIRFALVTTLPIALLWISKNLVVSGYPLYPFNFFRTDTGWAIPAELLDLMSFHNTGYGKLLPHGTTMPTKLFYWITQDGLAGIMIKLTLAVLFAMPFSMFKNKKYRMVYIALLVNFMALLFTSPQFRFFLHITLAGCLFTAAALYNYMKANNLVYKTMVFAGSALVFVSFFSLGLTKLTKNKRLQEHGKLQLQQILIPEGVTKYPDMKFVKVQLGNLEYNSPEYNFFAYGTANGPLPCVNNVQIIFFQKRLGIIPQLRTNDLKDGFYSATVPRN